MKTRPSTTTLLKAIRPVLVLLITLGSPAIGRAQPAVGDSAPTNSLLIGASDIHTRWHKVSLAEEKAAAERGEPTAQCHWAWRLESGEGVAKDPSGAAQWMRKAADQGLAAAQNALGWMYDRGSGVSEDRDAALDWTRKATDQGYTPADVNMGWMLANEKAKPGETIRGNYPVAAEWYEKAAKKGNVRGQFLLAELYRYRKLGDLERTNCIEWYAKAADQGHVEAQAALAELAAEFPNHALLQSGRIIPSLRQAAEKGNLDAQWELARRYRQGAGVPKDSAEGFRWMQRAADNRKESTRVVDAWYELGVMHETGEGTAKNPAAAWPLYLAAAEASPDAVFRVGRMYEEGTGVAQDDKIAAEYYARAATRGWGNHITDAFERLARLYAAGRGLSKDKSEAEEQLKVLGRSADARIQFQLGEMYSQGRVVAKDMEVAVRHLTQASKLGSVEAVNHIGELWASGLNGAPDFKEAVACYRQAANRSFPKAQFNLGMAYAGGEGVLVKKVEAWRWLNAAALQSFEPARVELRNLEAGMTPEQLAEAKAKGSPVPPKKQP